MQPTGGQSWSNAIQGVGNSISGTIDQLGAQHRQLKALRTMATDGLGMDADDVDGMSVSQLTGVMQAAALKSASQTRQAQAADLQSQARERDSIGAMRQATANRGTADAEAMKTFNTLISGVDDPSKLTPGQVQKFMGQAGLSAESQKTIGDGYRMMTEGGAGGDMMFNEDPITGARFAVKGKQVLPSGANPSKVAAPQAVSLLDAQGNATGTQVIPHPNGKGFTVVKGPNVAQAGRLDEQTVNGYQQQLFGDGAMKQGLYDQIKTADLQNAKAKAGLPDPATAGKLKYQPFPQDQYDAMKAAAARITGALKQHDAAASGAPSAVTPAVPAPGASAGKVLTPDVVQQFLQQTGGDKDAARQLATQQGYQY